MSARNDTTRKNMTPEHVDRLTERAGRWLAARTTRRSFLANSAKAALLATGGASFASLVQNRADARVCGQTGISPMCPTYDCVGPDVVWGYCWYASPGCCANGGLKKICDCCGVNYPNVHGYCPEGTNVYCVVESCLEDPRVQKVGLERFSATTPAVASISALTLRPDGSAPAIVAVDARATLLASVAVSYAGERGVPLVLIDPAADAATNAALSAQLTRIGARSATVIGGLAPSVLQSVGVSDITRFFDGSEDLAQVSIRIAEELATRTGRREAVAIGADAESIALAPLAGAYAASRRRPLLISPDAAGAFRGESGAALLLVGNEAAAANGRFAGSLAVTGTVEEVSLTLAYRAAQATTTVLPITIVPGASTALALGVLPNGGPVLALGGAPDLPPTLSDRGRDTLAAIRTRLSLAELVRPADGPRNDRIVYELQSALNGYDAHFLVGQDGDGLPVYAQPLEERVIGKARIAGELPPTSSTIARLAQRRSPTTAPVGVSPPATPAPRKLTPAPPLAPIFVPKKSNPTLATVARRPPSSAPSAPVAPVSVASTPASSVAANGAVPVTTLPQLRPADA